MTQPQQNVQKKNISFNFMLTDEELEDKLETINKSPDAFPPYFDDSEV